MVEVAIARNAMATRFEILLYGDNPVALRAAGEEALDEIERLERQFSLYRPSSELSNINSLAAIRPVRVEPRLFHLLQHAERLHAESHRAFDITITPLMKAWGFMRGMGSLPDSEELEEVRRKIGMHLVKLGEEEFTVQFEREGVMIDLGSIGKGYALERGSEILREAGVSSALLQGGTSTTYALGHPPGDDAWKVAIERPGKNPHREIACARSFNPEQNDWRDLLAVIPLKDESLSVSAVWGKSFEQNGKVYGHVIDPRNGRPVDGALLAAVILPSATESDALSTALLVLGVPGIDQIASLRPGMRALVVAQGDEANQLHIRTKGIDVGLIEN